MRHKITLFLSILIFLQTSFANSYIQTMPGAWTALGKAGKVNSSFNYFLKAENRYFQKKGADNLLNLTSMLSHPLNNEQKVNVAYQLFHSYIKPSIGDRNENRFYEAWVISMPGQINTLAFTTTFEQRKREGVNGWGDRLWQKAEYDIPWKKIKVITYDEIYLNVTHPRWVSSALISENRLFFGINVPATQNSQFIIGYLNRYTSGITVNKLAHLLYTEVDFT